MHGDLAFFELGVEDPERGRAFYGRLLRWDFAPGPSGGGFMISTPSGRGGMHGGDAGAAPYAFFEVDDIEAALEQVRALGGTVEDMDVEGPEESWATSGRFKLCRD